MPKPSKKRTDRDNPEWTEKEFARAVPFSELPAKVRKVLEKRKRGPQKAPTKVAISIRLSKDVVDTLRSTGEGWQGRVDDALRSWINLQPAERGRANRSV